MGRGMLLALMLLAIATPTGATSWVKLSPEQVQQGVDLLAVGRVIRAVPAPTSAHRERPDWRPWLVAGAGLPFLGWAWYRRRGVPGANAR